MSFLIPVGRRRKGRHIPSRQYTCIYWLSHVIHPKLGVNRLYYLPQASSQKEGKAELPDVRNWDTVIFRVLLTRSVLSIWHSWVLIYFPIAWFFQLEANAYPLATGVKEPWWTSPPVWMHAMREREIPKGKWESEADEKQESPYIALIRMWSPWKQNSWLSLLYICGCTWQNAAVNQSVISFFSQEPEFVFSSLFWFVSLSFVSSRNEWILKSDRSGMKFQLHYPSLCSFGQDTLLSMSQFSYLQNMEIETMRLLNKWNNTVHVNHFASA